MLITLDEYRKMLAGYYVTDCVVRDRNKFVFVASSWYTDAQVEEEERNGWDPAFRPKQLLPFFRDDIEGSRLEFVTVREWSYTHGGAATKPLNQFIAVELENDKVFVTGSGEVYEDAPLNSSMSNNPLRGGIRRVKTINGYAYICGGSRSFGKRMGKSQWWSNFNGLVHDKENYLDEGFDDFDGFSETDIYAVGGKGDVWHFNGEKWQQIAFPTNTYVLTVCCGGDGNVYISCYEGLTFVGRGNRWKEIRGVGRIALGFKDMVWHGDRAWCTNDNGIWSIRNGNELVYESDLPSEVRVCSGNMYVNDGVLLVAGLGGAAFLENGQWQVVFLRGEMEQALREQTGTK